MRVVTPGQAARHTGSKYLGVLVAAKMARNLNELRRNELMEDPTVAGDEPREKLTTIALEEVRACTVDFHLADRLRPGQL
jgi:DNA-directed RNA polymerase omega subunit